MFTVYNCGPRIDGARTKHKFTLVELVCVVLGQTRARYIAAAAPWWRRRTKPRVDTPVSCATAAQLPCRQAVVSR